MTDQDQQRFTQSYVETLRELMQSLPLKDRLEGVPVADRLEGVPEDERLLAMPIEALRALPDSYLATLSEDVRAAVLARRATPP